MSETEPFSLEIFHSLPPGIAKFLYLPERLRGQLIAECLTRTREDAHFFLSEGRTIQDFALGTILPSGNTVIQDEQGRNMVQAPIPEFLKK